MSLHPARRRRNRAPLRAFAALILAALAHAVAVGILLLVSEPRPVAAPQPRPVALRAVRSDDWEKNRRIDADRVTQPVDEKKREEKRQDLPKGQTVAVEEGNRQKPPDDARFLAERDNKVERETRSRFRTRDYVNPKAVPTTNQGAVTGGNSLVQQRPQEQSAGVKRRDAPDGPPAKARMELPDVEKNDEIAMKRTPSTALPLDGSRAQSRQSSSPYVGNSSRYKVSPGAGDGPEAETSGNGQRVREGRLLLVPSAQAVDQIIGAPANDHLEDVEEGDGTFLNTREFRYAAYFNRLRQAVGSYWRPDEKMRVRDPTGDMYAGKDRLTVLAITLDEEGNLSEVRVAKSSGLDFLDLAAVESFQRAQPFPNPPPGLLTDDAKVRFQFGFMVEMNRGPKLRFYRGGF